MSSGKNRDSFLANSDFFLFSLLFSLNFYYERFSTYESINFIIKIPQIIYLLLFQIFIFFLLKKILNKISNIKLLNIIKVCLKSWLLVIFLQTCFFFYGSLSLNDFLETFFFNLGFKNNIFLKPFVIILPYAVSLFFINFWNENRYSLIRFLKVSTYVFLIFFFYREIFIYPDSYFKNMYKKSSTIETKIKSNDEKTITLWLIFDEYDPNFIEELNLENNFKYFNTFKEESIYFENIIPSAKQSKFSMMGIFTGFNFNNIKINNKEIFLFNNQGKKMRYDFKETIFQKLLDNNYDFAILSSVLKYCSVYFKFYNLNNCFEVNENIKILNQLSVFNKKNYNGIVFHYSLVNYISNFIKLLSKKEIKKDNKKYYQKIINLDDEFKINDFDGRNFVTLNKIKSLINQNQYSLIFAHVNMPHLPSKFSEKKFKINLKNNDSYENYILNLKYNDLIFKDLLKLQKESNKINLIVSSDHWFREKDLETNKYYRTLLAVKLNNEKNFFKVKRRLNAGVLYDVIESIIINQSNTHEKIINDLSGTKYSEPCYNKICLN